MSICPSCVFQTQCSFPCHLWQRLKVCVKLLLIFRHCSQHAASLHFRLPPWRWWMNQTLEQYLHVYCNYQQDNWSKLLSLVEFAYNNALSTTTSVSPFFANKGYHLNITVHPECDIASSWAHNFAIDLNELQNTLKAEISTAQQYYQKSADVRCSPAPDFKVGDKVFVKAQFFRTTWSSKKLSKKYLGPYEIISQPGTLLFTLRLPESMCSVHPVFHVSMLKPATSNTFSKRIQLAPAPVIIDGKPEYEISRIVDSKIDC